ncbi:MAG: response regulator [Bacteroidota bacterium]
MTNQPTTESKNKTILVIEDEKFALDSIERLLVREGYTVRKAMSRAEAKEEIDKGGCDLVITDIMLPHLGGFEVIDHVRDVSPMKEVPILISTGMDKDIFDNTTSRANDYICKPYELKELLVKVKSLLN